MITMRSLASGPSAGAICGGQGRSVSVTPPRAKPPLCGMCPHAGTPPCPSRADNQDAVDLGFYSYEEQNHSPRAPFSVLSSGKGKLRHKALTQPLIPTHLDGGASKPCQLLDVLPLLPDDGPHCLCWDEQVHNLLLRQLERAGKSQRVREELHQAVASPCQHSRPEEVVGWVGLSWVLLGWAVVQAHIPCSLPALPKGAQGKTSWQEVPGHFWGKETYGVLMGEGASWGGSIQTRQIG